MSDYKRETYYLYNYENGRKRNNVGFARVEQFGGNCKITSRIRVPSMNGKTMEVCLFVREQGEMRFLPIGKMQISNMTGEFRTSLDADNILDLGYGMGQVQGMVIYDCVQKFFGSEWDDQKIVFYEFKLAGKKDEKKKKEEIKNEGMKQEKKTEDKKENAVFAAGLSNTEISRERLYHVSAEIKPGEEIMPEEKIMAEEKTVLQKEENTNSFVRNNEEPRQKQNRTENIPAGKSLSAKKPKERSKDLPDIFYQFPQMYPFEDDEMTDCVRIEPQDIGRLPMESWILANNSFLLHSYYSYRHLMLARKVCSSGFEYVLCAPGICQSREQFMAAMFGFCDFKPVRPVEDKTGEFGYWYMPVMIEEYR